MQITIKTKNHNYNLTLKQYIKPLQKIMAGLKKEYGLSLPDSLTLRPLREYNYRKRKRNDYVCGRAGYSPGKGYWIALNMDICGDIECGIAILQEEAAHITEALKTRRWGHGKLFKEIYKKTGQYIKKEES